MVAKKVGGQNNNMSQFFTVRQTTTNETEVIVNDSVASAEAIIGNHRQSNPEQKVILDCVVDTSDEEDEGSTSSNSASSPATVTLASASDTIQLMGMASALPTSNLYVNYPHTMWERDAEGNRIPVTVIKAEDVNSANGGAGVGGSQDLLSQATATIKTEVGDVGSNTTVTTITIPAQQNQAVVSPSTSSSSGGSGPQQRIVVTKSSSSASQAAAAGSNGEVLIRPHVCEVCTKTFAKREHLTKHLRIHKSDNKRYSCEYCQKAFRDRYELVRHTRRHTGDFPFR